MIENLLMDDKEEDGHSTIPIGYQFYEHALVFDPYLIKRCKLLSYIFFRPSGSFVLTDSDSIHGNQMTYIEQMAFILICHMVDKHHFSIISADTM